MKASDKLHARRRANSVIAAITIDVILAPFLFNAWLAWGLEGPAHPERNEEYTLALIGMIILVIVPWIVSVIIFRKNRILTKEDPAKGWRLP